MEWSVYDDRIMDDLEAAYGQVDDAYFVTCPDCGETVDETDTINGVCRACLEEVEDD